MTQALLKLFGDWHPKQVNINPSSNTIMFLENNQSTNEIDLDVPVKGTVYGTLLNYKGELELLRSQLFEAPYKALPSAPVLYIKPKNTHSAMHKPIPLPLDSPNLQIGASLGVVIGQPTTKVSEEEALEHVLGYTIVNDVSIPHRSYYRPAIKQKARDGFCPIGPWIVLKEEVVNPDNLTIQVFINNELKQKNSTSNLIRPIGQLISDISQFMTLNEGDTLLVGVPENPPLAQEGDKVHIEIEGIGYLENTIQSL